MAFGISNINIYFAKMEEHLINEHKKEKKNKSNEKRKVVKIVEPNIINKHDSSLKNKI